MRKKQKPMLIKRVQSTQQNIPIKDIVNGIVITKDNTYIKIIEVKPIPYFLKSIKDRNAIYSTFCRMLKSSPFDIQIKTVSLSSNLSVQLEILEKEKNEENNARCVEIDNEYKKRLLRSQEDGITRRFFIVISKKMQRTIGKKTNPSEMINWLETEAGTIRGYLSSCGNEIVSPKKDELNKYTAKIFYTLLNRGSYQTETFEEHLDMIYKKYFAEYKSANFFIPPYEYIAPSKISFTNSKYVVIDDMYYKYAYVPSNGYDSMLSAGWINIFSNTFSGVDVDVFLKKMDKTQMMNNLRRNISYSLVGANEASVTSEAFDSANETYSSSTYLKNGLSNNEDFYYMSTLVTVCDKNPEVLDYKMNELIKRAKSNDFILKEISFEAENAFKSTLLFNNLDSVLYEKTKRNVLTEGAGTVYPFTAFEINDEDGVYLGNDAQTGSLAIVDIFKKHQITNSNIFICGQTGAGKTYTLLLLAIRMRIKHIPVFIIAPEKQNEFKRLCNAVGGQFVEFGPGSQSKINVMEIFKKNEEAEKEIARIDGSRSNTSQLAEKVDTVKRFVQLITGTITKEQEGLLSETIFDTYQRFGIERNNDSLWADESKTHYKKMPTLSDLCESLKEKSKSEPSMKTIYNIVKAFVKTSGVTFDGQTNIDVNNEFVVFGLEHMNEEDVAIGVYQTMDYCWGKIKQDRKRKALFIDEWWRMAKNNIAANYSQEISKVIRAYNGAMVIATQQMGDIMLSDKNEIGEAVLNNCDTKILMKMTEFDAQKVQEIMMLTEDEKEKITRSEKGSALFVYGKNKMQLRFVATKTEDELITTDPKQLEQIAKKNEIKEKQKEKQSIIDKAKNLDDYLLEAFEYNSLDDNILLDSQSYVKTSSLDAIEVIDSNKYIEEGE